MPAAQEIMNQQRLRGSGKIGILLHDQVLQQKTLYYVLGWGFFPIITILTVLL